MGRKVGTSIAGLMLHKFCSQKGPSPLLFLFSSSFFKERESSTSFRYVYSSSKCVPLYCSPEAKTFVAIEIFYWRLMPSKTDGHVRGHLQTMWTAEGGGGVTKMSMFVHMGEGGLGLCPCGLWFPHFYIWFREFASTGWVMNEV